MKLVIAVIQPTKLKAAREAMVKVGVERMTVCDAQGFGQQRGKTEMYRGHEYTTHLLRKIALEIVVNDDFLDRTVETLYEVCRPGACADDGVHIGREIRAIHLAAQQLGRTDHASENVVEVVAHTG